MRPDRQIGFRGSVEYRRKLQQEALNRGVKVQELIERAVDTYLGEAKNGTANAAVLDPPSKDSYQENPGLKYYVNTRAERITAEHKRWLEMLTGILLSGHKVAISAVTQNLIAFDLLVHSAAAGGTHERAGSPPVSSTTKGIDDKGEFKPIESIPELDARPGKKRRDAKRSDRKTG